MSKHIGRKQRWTQDSTTQYSSRWGTVVYRQNAWYGLLDYRTRASQPRADDLTAWEQHRVQLGPFKRPRNAMVALEREATFLKNRHGADVLFQDEVWAEASS